MPLSRSPAGHRTRPCSPSRRPWQTADFGVAAKYAEADFLRACPTRADSYGTTYVTEISHNPKSNAITQGKTCLAFLLTRPLRPGVNNTALVS